MVIIYAALCCAAISFTITVTSMFRWLRELVSRIHPKLEELIHCPWCLGHYVAAICLLTSDIEYISVSKYGVYNFLFTWFALICLMGLIHYVLLRAYEPIARMMMERQLRNESDRERSEEAG